MEAHILREAKHQVHVLKGGAGLSLHQVVNMSYDAEAVNARIYADNEIAKVSATHVECTDCSSAAVDTDERALFKKFTIEGDDLSFGHGGCQGSIER